MDITRLSSKGQVVIPRAVRERLKLEPGQQFTVVARGDQLTLVPLGDVRSLRGRLKGASTEGSRDRSDAAK